MKAIAAIFLLVTLTSTINDVSGQGIIIDAAMRRILENLRVLMRTGNPESGFPVLAPFFHPDAHVNVSFGGLFDLDARFFPFHMTGLDEFVGRLQVDLSNLQNIRFPFEFRYNDEIQMHGFYDMIGRMYGLIPIFGFGDFRIRPRGVLLTGWANVMDNGEGFLTLSDFSISLQMDSLESNIQGLLLGGDLSDLLNVVIEDIVPSMLRRFPEGMTQLLTTLVTPMANRFLATRRMEDLMALLFPRG
ncbi:uncharacterized protein LOC129751909 [Uranotaenia lowii]|uniref:uncharacterized protein LOC129751909 n=1 Tax=Uranotaenia lowii TaxID=190385 RepID=UPI00247A12A0|nr:uncharacterized protein LOC129751909 [Uranotaenia lowii]